MNHCINCGKRLSRGRTAHSNDRVMVCLVCRVKRDMKDWRFETAATKLRRIAREAERTKE